MFFGFFFVCWAFWCFAADKDAVIKDFFCAVGYVKMDVVQIFPSFVAGTYTVITFLIFAEINQLEV